MKALMLVIVLFTQGENTIATFAIPYENVYDCLEFSDDVELTFNNSFTGPVEVVTMCVPTAK